MKKSPIIALSALALIATVITVARPLHAQGGKTVTPAPAAQTTTGSNKTTTATLPANFPADVPVPVGQILAARQVGTGWTVSLFAKGASPVVVQTIKDQYAAAGYTLSNLSEDPMLFENSGHSVSIYWRTYDHGPEATELLMSVTPKQ